MRVPADIAVYDENDQISVLVEVRAWPKSSPKQAKETRRDVLEVSGFVPRYFLVVARDLAYIWNGPTPPDADPDQVFETNQLFHHYFEYINSDPDSIASSALELMVGIWLSDMTLRTDGADAALEESGLRSAVVNGRVEFLTAA